MDDLVWTGATRILAHCTGRRWTGQNGHIS